MIRCDRLPPENKLVFSDDSALLPADMRRHIQKWLSGWNSKPWLILREPIKCASYTDWDNIDVTSITEKHRCFTAQLWRAENRLFRVAIDTEHKLKILGPEISPKDGNVISTSPVVEVIIKATQALGMSLQEKAKLAAEVYATLSDYERREYPRIGHMAALADLNDLTL